MHNSSACAAKGEHSAQARRLFNRSNERASINIYKTSDTFEVLVFAPGRIKEHFQLEVKANHLTVSYNPPVGFPRPEWVVREYSRGGFSRTIALNGSIDPEKITAKYLDGVLQVSLPLVPEPEMSKHSISIQ